jgi:hypothetical protein
MHTSMYKLLYIHSDLLHVSTKHVAFFREVKFMYFKLWVLWLSFYICGLVLILFSNLVTICDVLILYVLFLCRRPRVLQHHVAVRCVYKWCQYNFVHFVGIATSTTATTATTTATASTTTTLLLLLRILLLLLLLLILILLLLLLLLLKKLKQSS